MLLNKNNVYYDVQITKYVHFDTKIKTFLQTLKVM